MTGSQIQVWLEEQGLRLAGGIVVLVAGLALVHWVIKLMERREHFTKIDPTLKGFLGNLTRVLLYCIVILIAASTMGISMTSVITILASAGVAVSLGVQGAISNFVGGVMLLLLKPIRVGEFIRAGEMEGSVVKIGTIYTELRTPDNRHISVPNSNLTNTPIINYTREGTRRLDVPFGVSYSSNAEQVRRVLLGVCGTYSAKILADPEPQVLLSECADSCLKFLLRVWCRADDYLLLAFLLPEKGKEALDAAGITIPFPQLDVHLKQD